MDNKKVKNTSSMDRLSEMTNKLPVIQSNIQYSNNISEFIEYKMEHGTAFAWTLLNRPEIICRRHFGSYGSEFPVSGKNSNREWLIVYKGSMVVRKDDVDVTLHSGESIINEIDNNYTVLFLEDCEYVLITLQYQQL